MLAYSTCGIFRSQPFVYLTPFGLRMLGWPIYSTTLRSGDFRFLRLTVVRSRMPGCLAYLQRMPLTYLSLTGSQLSDEGLVHLRELPLQNLNLLSCPNISDDGLVHLQQLKLFSLRGPEILLAEPAISTRFRSRER
jgi:hypothetical protein